MLVNYLRQKLLFYKNNSHNHPNRMLMPITRYVCETKEAKIWKMEQYLRILTSLLAAACARLLRFASPSCHRHCINICHFTGVGFTVSMCYTSFSCWFAISFVSNTHHPPSGSRCRIVFASVSVVFCL